ncbi:MaoC family dehydratase N-terminal domain-containing protein [Aurantimonas sp. Leaf443]|uniref:FAS1-like dehydratase domain-containing protein n=1 Tax=Aurantimonas sp. Leaf443 TaxID=1736378 RepID=UPI0006F50D2D|nr:MaoC family dehydratase N-terminal domain-containing protein [Aurantimonas sp. Leaf443]KQT85237.1 protein dehydratase [Aurantimonas sp. Leaf443]
MGDEGSAIDIDRLRGWIGREEEARDAIDLRLARSLAATLGDDPAAVAEGAPAPLCVHWCLAPAIVPEAETGSDGHPARGGFLPPVPLPRRMWAGGEILFEAPLRVGDAVTRRSRIEDVTLKTGRSGPLCFVAVRHRYEVAGALAVEERHDIVYRAAEPAGTRPSAPVPAPAVESRAAAHERLVQPTSLTLFRYSALTFNGHRIHYDETYAKAEEAYPGLVVHGPLQATLLARLAADALGAPPRRFAYRGVRPFFLGGPLRLTADPAGEGVGGLRLRSLGADGLTRMEAEAA